MRQFGVESRREYVIQLGSSFLEQYGAGKILIPLTLPENLNVILKLVIKVVSTYQANICYFSEMNDKMISLF